ncbi:MAG TPA: MBL fold metallo-hydrolase [Chthoniobacterales bacterium]|nr:MBL fold metallo-hydrolase [Chthoniobacterales bacterium]
MPKPFSRKKRTHVVRAGAGNGAEKPSAKRVGLKPGLDWHKRNFLTEVLIPSLFTKRSGLRANPLFPKVDPGEICITWIGHASFLIQIGGMNVLIDPNWSMWLSVIKRLKRPGLNLDNLPSIDTVLVTHAHFDHLDRRTLRRVAADQPIVVPTGVGNLVHDLGFNIVHELDEWQDVRLGPLKVSLTPCHHWGARMLHDQHRGFGGFVIQTNGRSIFHCGDSAYFNGFEEIGKRFPIEVALLPIGAYDAPSKREVHMNPEEAVRAFLELRGRTLVPMHYGTFRLGFEPLDEPPQRLLSSARAHGVDDKVLLMTEGKPVVL